MTPAAPAAPARAVLVARAPARAAGLAARLRGTGLEVVVAPVIERAPADDLAPLDAAVRGLARGAYVWAVVTSVNAVDALADAAARTGTSLAGTPARWATIGPATTRALAAAGVTTDLVPPEDATAAGLVAAFPDPAVTDPETPAVLLPLGDLARPTLDDGLADRGWAPHVVTAYRTVRHALPADVVERARAGGFDVVVVSSGSVAREIAAQAGTGTPVVAIGTPSADAAREAGLRVAAVAAHPTDDALAHAVEQALSELALSGLAPSEPRPTGANREPDTSPKENP